MLDIQVSVAMSLDGHIDDRNSERLILSSVEDFEDVHACRAEADAIFVGAGTIRKDNPSLLFRDPKLIASRLAHGRSAELTKITVTTTGAISPSAKFFDGDARKIVLCPKDREESIRTTLGKVAEILGVASLEPRSMVRELETLGIQKLFIEGGTSILTQFIGSGTFHRLRIAVAPLFVGNDGAPRIIRGSSFPDEMKHRLILNNVRRLGDVTVMDLQNVSQSA